MQVSKPEVKAMLVCDNVIIEQGTNKYSVIGIFENIIAPNFPYIHGSLSIFINFTSALGKYKFRLELVEVDNNVTVGYSEISETEYYEDKLASKKLVFALSGLKFDRPGKYEFRFLVNGEMCETKTFNVKQS